VHDRRSRLKRPQSHAVGSERYGQGGLQCTVLASSIAAIGASTSRATITRLQSAMRRLLTAAAAAVVVAAAAAAREFHSASLCPLGM
jgi:hypothetical protein